MVGRPVSILILAGALNAFVLPLAMGIILFASRRETMMKRYRHPGWLIIAGWVVVVALAWMCFHALADLGQLWNQ